LLCFALILIGVLVFNKGSLGLGHQWRW